eukprot:7585745-Pyramimonas_sp.AAC.1
MKGAHRATVASLHSANKVSRWPGGNDLGGPMIPKQHNVGLLEPPILNCAGPFLEVVGESGFGMKR